MRIHPRLGRHRRRHTRSVMENRHIASDADWRDVIGQAAARALTGMIFEAAALSVRTKTLSPHLDGSPGARYAPPHDAQTDSGKARAYLWQMGLGELFTRMEVAIDCARQIRTIALHDRSATIAPLVLGRPLLEAAADTHYLVGNPRRDPLVRFAAFHLRDLVREAPVAIGRKQHPASPTTPSQQMQDRWEAALDIVRLAGFTIEFNEEPDKILGPLPRRVVDAQGKAASLNQNVSSILGSMMSEVSGLYMWRLASGASHATPWLAGSEIRNAVNQESRGATMSAATHMVQFGLGHLCDDLNRFTGHGTPGCRARNFDRLREIQLLHRDGILADPRSRIYRHAVLGIRADSSSAPCVATPEVKIPGSGR